MKLAKITESTFKFQDAEFTIGNLLSGDLSEITDASTEVQVTLEENENGNVVPVRSITTSKKKQDELAVVKRVKAWKNINDEAGKELECTTENKLRFCRENAPDVFSEFMEKLGKESLKLDKATKKQAEKKAKN